MDLEKFSIDLATQIKTVGVRWVQNLAVAAYWSKSDYTRDTKPKILDFSENTHVYSVTAKDLERIASSVISGAIDDLVSIMQVHETSCDQEFGEIFNRLYFNGISEGKVLDDSMLKKIIQVSLEYRADVFDKQMQIKEAYALANKDNVWKPDKVFWLETNAYQYKSLEKYKRLKVHRVHVIQLDGKWHKINVRPYNIEGSYIASISSNTI